MLFSSPENQISRARPFLGTLVIIRARCALAADAARVVESGFSQIAEIHRLMSFHESDSDVGRLNRNALIGPVAVHPLTYDVLRLAMEISQASSGLFDVTVAGKLVEWGYLPNPGADHPASDGASWRDIELLADGRIRFHRPLWIDLGGIAKGYAVDRAITMMEAQSSGQFLVNAGGDLRVSGPAAERIALAVPNHRGNRAPAVDIQNGSVASSSGREGAKRHRSRMVGRHVHGRRLDAVGTRSFVTVIAERCVIADALTKVVLAQGRRSAKILEIFHAAAYLNMAGRGSFFLGAPFPTPESTEGRDLTGDEIRSEPREDPMILEAANDRSAH